MDGNQTHQHEAIIASFELAYKTYLDIEGLLDHVSIKLGFYTVVSDMLVREPHPDKAIQESTIDYVDRLCSTLIEEALGLVHGIIMSNAEDGVR